MNNYSNEKAAAEVTIHNRTRISRAIRRGLAVLSVTAGVGIGWTSRNETNPEELLLFAVPVLAIGAAVIDKKSRQQKCQKLIRDFASKRDGQSAAIPKAEIYKPVLEDSLLGDWGKTLRPGNYLTMAAGMGSLTASVVMHFDLQVALAIILNGAYTGAAVQSARYFDRDLSAEETAYYDQLEFIDYHNQPSAI